MKAIAQERRRFGYRRLLVMLRRESLVVNHKKLFRLITERGRPRMIVSDNGSEFTSNAILGRPRPSLHPPSRAQPTPETNSKLDRNWGQRQRRSCLYARLQGKNLITGKSSAELVTMARAQKVSRAIAPTIYAVSRKSWQS